MKLCIQVSSLLLLAGIIYFTFYYIMYILMFENTGDLKK
jgi:hypothetical protein